jgi:uncharacterized protein (TIGR03118 family)
MRRTAFLARIGVGVGLSLLPIVATAGDEGYKETDLVSDIAHLAKRTDPNLVNPWGVAQNPQNKAVWVADNGMGVATVYGPNGRPVPDPHHPLVVTIPPPTGSAGPAAPTGLVFNPTQDFVVSKGAASGPSLFLFVTEDGTISGWNPTVDSTHAILKVDHSTMGAVYKGATLAETNTGPFLYVANFCGGTIEVYDGTFTPVTLAPGSFTDPSLPAGFGPFNIRNLNGVLYVTYAKQKAGPCHDDDAGPGNGFVNVFGFDGTFLERVASKGTLNSPWGLALAPPTFGLFANTLLVGNFGDGRINAFTAGSLLGQLEDEHGTVIVIDGLWSLVFAADPSNRLFFSAGINDESHGLFGRIQPE